MEYETIPFNRYSNETLEQLQKGAFLTTKKHDKVNTMTIAWGGINFVWGKPLFVVYVRYSRNTYEMLGDNDEFTVSVPSLNTMKEELAYCGTNSGRDTNKIKDCNLALAKGRTVNTPILKDCLTHYECKIVYRQAMEPNSLQKQIQQRHYRDNNYHVIYYGEVVDAYRIKGV